MEKYIFDENDYLVIVIDVKEKEKKKKIINRRNVPQERK